MWNFLLGRDFANFRDRSDFIFKMFDHEIYLHIKVHKLEKGKRLFVLVSDISRIKELEHIEFKLMRMFFSSVAHELRTPLNSIIPMSKNLSEFVQQEGQVILKVIINSAHHLENVVNDALDISRIENGQFEPIYDWFNVRESVKEVQEIMDF
jgi:signal transduction histidine kinase